MHVKANYSKQEVFKRTKTRGNKRRPHRRRTPGQWGDGGKDRAVPVYIGVWATSQEKREKKQTKAKKAYNTESNRGGKLKGNRRGTSTEKTQKTT